jgi:histidyl-tRNA synthetase
MTEVVGDIAVSLAIESAAISRHQKVSNVKLATSHRITRVQDFSSIPGFTQHFKMFGLSTSGIGSSDSEDAIVEHIDFYLSLLEFLKTMWCDFTDLTVYISDISMSMKMIQTAGLSMEEVRSMTDYEEEYDLCSKSKINVERYHESLSSVSGVQYSAFAATAERIKRLQQEYSSVKILYDLGRIAGINYYNGLCFKIVATNARGQTLPLADGGFSDWSAQLLHDKKRFCVTSGIGSEMFCREFGE